MSETLPPVAKSFYTECKKCNAERYHIVLTHTSATSAKIECEVCHSKKTYTINKKKETSASSGTKRVAKAKTSGAGSKASHEAQYEDLKNKIGNSVSYNMKTQFKMNDGLNHPKFGLGVVTQVFSDKVEVCFLDEVRSLVHNRG